MRNFKLTDAEARAIATEIAGSQNKIYNPEFNPNDWIKNYMRTYDKIMNAIMDYNSSVSDD